MNISALKKSSTILKENITEWLQGEPIVESEIELTEDALIRFAQEHAAPPSGSLRKSILSKLSRFNLANENRSILDLKNLPLLDENSNWLDWEETVKDIMPPENFGELHLHPLESNDERQLFIAWVRSFIDEEVHHDLIESFVLLEGSCECHITDTDGSARVVRMGVGDFISMMPGQTHDVVITSPEPAKAILQWVKSKEKRA